MAERRAQSASEIQALVFRSSSGAKWVLCFAFFLAVLFTVNAIVGAVWLARHNLWLDALIFLLLFAAGCWLFFFAAVFLFSAATTEVRFEPDRAVMLLPNWHGPTPFFPYKKASVPYGELAAIETRSEIYTYYILPIAVRGLTLVRKDGRRLKLGYTRENAAENAFDYDKVASEFARRANLGVTYKGAVKAGTRLRALLHKEPHAATPLLDEGEAARLRGSEGKAWKALIAAIAIVIVGGLAFQGVRIIAATFTASKPPTAVHAPAH
jgi:hypothetical protein